MQDQSEGRQFDTIARTNLPKPIKDVRGMHVASLTVLNVREINCWRNRNFRKINEKVKLNPIKNQTQNIVKFEPLRRLCTTDIESKTTAGIGE